MLDELLTRQNMPSTFVRARLIDQDGKEVINIKTNTFVGKDPGWNETLIMIYEAINKDKGLTIEEITKNESVLYVSVFDFVGVTEREYGSNKRYNIVLQEKFIGSFQIPLFTLFQNPKVNSYFKLNRPLALFGYKSSDLDIFKTSVNK